MFYKRWIGPNRFSLIHWQNTQLYERDNNPDSKKPVEMQLMANGQAYRLTSQQFFYLCRQTQQAILMNTLTADDLVYGYINGIFPMADADSTLYWYAPDPRAIIPLDTYKPAKSLRPVLNKKQFEIRINTNFEQVMRFCSFPRSDDDSTWISDEIIDAYTELFRMGLAHSVETYLDNRLVGGLYGVSLGAAFFGESMFHHVSNASKVAFHYLILILRQQHYELLDTQFINDNVRRYGAIEIPKADYLKLLKRALRKKARFSEPVLAHLFNDHVGE